MENQEIYDAKGYIPTNLSQFCFPFVKIGNNSYPYGDQLTPDIWSVSESGYGTLFFYLCMSILLIGCVISFVICYLACQKNTFQKAQGLVHALYIFTVFALTMIFGIFQKITLLVGNWIFGFTNCQRQNVCFYIIFFQSVLIVIQVVVAVLQVDFYSSIKFSHFYSKRNHLCAFAFVATFIMVPLTFALLISLIFPFAFPYFNQDLGICIWSFPQLVILFALLFGLKFINLLSRILRSFMKLSKLNNSPIRKLKSNIDSGNLRVKGLLIVEVSRTMLFILFGLCPLVLPYFTEIFTESTVLMISLSYLLFNNCIITALIIIASTNEYQRENTFQSFWNYIKGSSNSSKDACTWVNDRKAQQQLHLLKSGNVNVLDFFKNSNDLNTKIIDDGEWKTPLIIATQNGNVNLVKALIKKEAPVDNIIKGEDLTTALEYACFYGKLDVAKILLEKGSKSNGIDENGQETGIPLMEAARRGHDQIVKLLILHGANPNLPDSMFGRTALHWAIISNELDSCLLLMKAGGCLTQKRDKASNTPLDYARPHLKSVIQHHDDSCSFDERTFVVVMGDKECGKSTLITWLKNAGFTSHWFTMFKTIKCTFGIDVVQAESKRMGKVTFFDFNGHDSYLKAHEPFLKALLTSGRLITFLIVVDAKKAINKQLEKWISQIEFNEIVLAQNVEVLVIGSYLSSIFEICTVTKTSLKRNLKSCIDALPKLPNYIQLVDPCVLDCRRFDSSGIKAICKHIKNQSPCNAQELYNLNWIVTHLKESELTRVPAIKLSDLEVWLITNKSDLPIEHPSAKCICIDLAKKRNALYIQDQEVEGDNWLILDLPFVLHTVYGDLGSTFWRTDRKSYPSDEAVERIGYDIMLAST